MRNSKLIAFLMAMILCVLSVSAAFAKVPELDENEGDALAKIVCNLLKGEGYKADLNEDIRSVDFRYGDKEYIISLTNIDGDQFGAEITPKGVVRYLTSYSSWGGEVQDTSKLDKKTRKKIEKKVESFLKKANPSLLKKIGELKVTEYTKDGKTAYVEIKDSNKKVRFTLKIKNNVKILTYSEIRK